MLDLHTLELPAPFRQADDTLFSRIYPALWQLSLSEAKLSRTKTTFEPFEFFSSYILNSFS